MSSIGHATIEDVALIAEVSIATVSRTIHNLEKVSSLTRQRVNQAIAVTGYTANAMARGLRLGRSNVVLVVVPDIGDPNVSSILVGLENEARAHGYGVLTGHTQNEPMRGMEYLKYFSSNQAAGLILLQGCCRSAIRTSHRGCRRALACSSQSTMAAYPMSGWTT